ncbi:transcriptional regulator [Cohnella sp. CIP 111063]|jgi:Predicted transcription factor, homolog of eukaryotic MBF1|uniref:helix-turn-helix domain-containing protein n=1 Tax=unclassified Cohnella TaxID=2636738 RepID=UPI000B8BC429|nr:MULTISPECIES: helix-turn-helix transcriptional regulator [unclassified Cohnella]OXS58780.1 transcriptional regulator [Cohnella sp. CIP 111063]PRX71861.1 helix-turn-helix protein [Cohnella sp. SGD-V74]
MSEILTNVGKRIREIRKAQGLSQSALAEKCGFTFSYIGGVERAEKNISLLNLEKIAEGLGVGVHQFFTYSYQYEQLPASEKVIREIVSMLVRHDEQTIEMAKNILSEVLKHSRK